MLHYWFFMVVVSSWFHWNRALVKHNYDAGYKWAESKELININMCDLGELNKSTAFVEGCKAAVKAGDDSDE